MVARNSPIKNCDYCGRENADDATHCSECGTGKFVTAKEPAPPRLPSDQPLLRTYLKCLLTACTTICFLTLAGFAWVAFETWKHQVTILPPADMMEMAGGLKKINREAAALFARPERAREFFIERWELTNYPAIASLGNSFVIERDRHWNPQWIRIRYGTHSKTRWLFIYPPDSTNRVALPFPCVQIASNIFATK